MLKNILIGLSGWFHVIGLDTYRMIVVKAYFVCNQKSETHTVLVISVKTVR